MVLTDDTPGIDALDPKARQAPHLATTAAPVHYEVVIPTYRRWQPTKDVMSKRRLQRVESPDEAFILQHTLKFLERQNVAGSRVTLFVANDEEASKYRQAFCKSTWANVKIVVSAPGIRASRNFICQHFAEGTYVVSLDDDLEGISWKFQEGNDDSSTRLLPTGAFEKLVYDAFRRMKDSGAFLWGVNTSANPRCLSLSGVTKRNGLINGYIHGFICRPQSTDLLRTVGDAVEDCEFSVRNFAKDGIVLRYRMYAGKTAPYSNGGGLQATFAEKPAIVKVEGGISNGQDVAVDRGAARKQEEYRGAAELHRLFPRLIAAPETDNGSSLRTMQVKFISVESEWDERRRERPLQAAAEAKHRLKSGKFAQSFAKQTIEKAKSAQPLKLRDEDGIRYTETNPKKAATKSFARYERYQKAKTVAEAKSLGASTEDFRYDSSAGFLTVSDLNTTPTSHWVSLRDKDAVSTQTPAVASSKADLISVRFKEIKFQKYVNLLVAREDLLLLAQRGGGSLQRCPPGCWKMSKGPLADVPLEVVRILLHWARTGILAYPQKWSASVFNALRACGASELALKARCLEVASAQTGLDRFWKTPVAASGKPSSASTAASMKKDSLETSANDMKSQQELPRAPQGAAKTKKVRKEGPKPSQSQLTACLLSFVKNAMPEDNAPVPEEPCKRLSKALDVTVHVEEHREVDKATGSSSKPTTNVQSVHTPSPQAPATEPAASEASPGASPQALAPDVAKRIAENRAKALARKVGLVKQAQHEVVQPPGAVSRSVCKSADTGRGEDAESTPQAKISVSPRSSSKQDPEPVHHLDMVGKGEERKKRKLK